MRHRPIRLVGLTIGVLAGIMLVGTLVMSAAAAPSTPLTTRSGQSHAAPAPQTPPGGHAIHPHLATTSPTQAAFTAQDVINYLTPLYTAAKQPFAIAKVEFITAGDISTRLNGESIGVPSDALVCVVTVNTTFTTEIGPPAARRSVTISQVIQVFDAHTGNDLMTSYRVS